MKKQELINITNSMGIKTSLLNLLLEKETGLSKSDLFLLNEIEEKYIKKIESSLDKIKNGYPIEYVLENAEFYSLDFYVNNNVLIPRNDTEILVDKVLEEIINKEKVTLIDVGTGTSCIPISIILNTSKIENCYVIDISKEALGVSLVNIKKHSLEKKVKQIQGNLLNDIVGTKDYILSSNIIITANLPYIKNKDFENIDIETRKYEPALALYGGEKTGFELYEQLIKEIFILKKLNQSKTITLFIEIGFDQKEYSTSYLNNLGLKYYFFKDNNSIYRCIKIIF